jgi:hypothetical protein
VDSTFDWRTTLMGAVFQSPARLAWAADCGVQLTGDDQDHIQRIAGLHADVGTLSLAAEFGMALSDSTVEGAVCSGRTSVVQYLIQERHCALPWNAARSAADSGDIDMLICVRQNGLTFPRSTCARAASAGQLPALQYMLSTPVCTCEPAVTRACELCSWLVHSSLVDAAGSGNIDTVKWLQQQFGARLSGKAMSSAASGGHMPMCEYLHSQQCPWTSHACSSAAGGGYIEMLRWLREHGCPWHTQDMLIFAAQGGSIAVMQYLIQEGIASTAAQLTKMLLEAGLSRRLQAAQWLRQQGAQWPTKLRNTVGFTWQGEVLAWARAEGCTSPTR